MMILTTYSYCIDCGTYQEPEDKFCMNCGHLKESFKEISNDTPYHCPRCANPLASDYKYCPTCGSRSAIPSTIKHSNQVEKKGMTIKEINKVTDILNGKKPPEEYGQNMF